MKEECRMMLMPPSFYMLKEAMKIAMSMSQLFTLKNVKLSNILRGEYIYVHFRDG